MSTAKKVASGCIVLALAALSVWFMKHHGAAAQRREDETVDSAPSDKSDEVISAPAPPHAVASVKKWLSPQPPKQTRDDRGTDPFVAKDPMKASDYQAAAAIQKMQRLQTLWESGKPDKTWGQQLESYLGSEFAKKQIHGRFVELDCRSTLCRTTIEFDSAERLSDMNRFEYPEDNGGMFDTYIGEGRHLLRMFLAPAGVSLSSLLANPRR